MRIVESTVVPKSAAQPCADRLITGHQVVGVADGATAKPWDAPAGPDGVELAELAAAVLGGLPADARSAPTVCALTARVAELLDEAGIAPGAGSAVSFCVLHAGAREVWRVGEARVLVDGRPWARHRTGEAVVAAARALVLRARLAAGDPVESLAESDPGRQAVMELLRASVALRNSGDQRFGSAAIDGAEVPEASVEVLRLPAGECEVVLATDGYPEVAGTLAASERLLALRLRRDPLMIEDPPETKGLRPGANSFDDRAYLRVMLPVAPSAS
jgi:hypothetical protein